MGLHVALHGVAQLGNLGAALGVAGAIKAFQGSLAGLRRQRHLGDAGLDHLGGAMRGGAAEHDQIEQRVGAQAVGPVHGDAGRLAHRHQAGHDGVGVVRGRTQHLAMIVRRHAAHVVVHGRQHRDRLLGHFHAGEHLGRLGNARQALVQDIGAQVLQVQHDVVLIRTAATSRVDLQRHRAGNHIARGEVLRRGRIALHEALAFGVGQVAALAARALGDQAACGEDAGGMKLHELHVLDGQAGSDRHAGAVAGAGMGGGAGQIGTAIAAGRQHHALGAEAMDGAVFQVPGHHAAAHAVCVHDQVKGEIFDEEFYLVLQTLLIQRVQDGMAGAVRRGAGAHGGGLAVIHHVAAERALIDAAILGAAERHAEMLQLIDRRNGLAAHVFDGILIAEPIRSLHGVVHVPAPIVLAHVAECGADAALGGHSMAAGGKHLGDASGLQSGRAHPQRGPQAGAAGTDHNNIIGVIDNGVGPR